MTSFDAGLIVLVLSVIPSFIASMIQPDIVYMLEGNPQFFSSYLLKIVILGVLPPSVGVALCLLGFRQEKTSTILSFLMRMAFPCFVSLLWGFFLLQGTLRNLDSALYLTPDLHVESLLLKIFGTFEVVAAIWLFSGLLLAFTLAHKVDRKDPVI